MNVTAYVRITDSLFETVYNALMSYVYCSPDHMERKVELRTRFCAMWEMIEAAELVEEYESWRYENI